MTSTPTFAIEARGLEKRYGDSVALDGVDLAVATGSVCGLLGPNGAGKTTAVRILTTLSTMDRGTARVAGFDVGTAAQEVRRRIGLAAQDATVDGLLTGLENLVMIGELHHLGRATARRRGRELLAQFSLVEAGDKLAKEYSGGMRRRLDLAATLVAGPEVLFLDEPTTGLDPRGRNELWAVLDTLVDSGTTVLLTTQYLEEAERLADDIVVIDHGRVIARGDARQLKRQIGGDQLVIVPVHSADLAAVAAIVERVVGVRPTIDPPTRVVTAPAATGAAAIAAVATELVAAGIEVEDLGLHQPTLDDVFLTLTSTSSVAPPAPAPEEALR